ncbi:SMP-30/gluconolactonase/LRE family protein [Ruegeria sp. SCPT10]|uniref:SMP-30/gluconolactonase/LRE family protein n=1 Tax=Ruegeria sp. SCP10 TaxID=3141377 RepID=UPI00333807BD
MRPIQPNKGFSKDFDGRVHDPKALTAHLLVDCKCELGEGVQWNDALGRLYWTDIFGNALWSCDENGYSVERLELGARLCAFVFTSDVRVLAAFADGLYWLELSSGQRDLIQEYQPELPQTRMNDGNLDRQGRFIVGGMDDVDGALITPVLRVSPSGIECIIENVGCANSIAFSPDGRSMFFADSTGHEIYQYDYDRVSGKPTNKRVFAAMEPEFGVPDGSTVDCEGALWSARFGGSCVQRFLSDGSLDLLVSLPVPNVTCCCLGGGEMNRLFITTARAGMTGAEQAAMPEAGGIYAVDVPVRGLPHGRYKQ